MRVEALLTAAPKLEVELAIPPVLGRLAERRRGVILRADDVVSVCPEHYNRRDIADLHRNRRSARENGRR